MNIYILIYLFTLIATGISSRIYRYGLNASVLALIIFAVFKDDSVSRDMGVYKTWYNNLISLSLFDPFLFKKDIGFSVLAYFSGILKTGPTIFYGTFITAGLLLKIKAIDDYAQFKRFSFIMYLSVWFLLWEMNQLRTAFSAGIFLYAIRYLYDKKILKYILFIAVASLFHASALIYLTIPLFRKIRSVFLFLPLLVLIVIALFEINLSDYYLFYLKSIFGERVENYMYSMYSGEHSKINLFGSGRVLDLGILIILFGFSSALDKGDKYFQLFFNSYLFGFMLFYFFKDIPVIAYRLAELFWILKIFLIPSLITIIRPRYVPKVIVYGIAFFTLYHYWKIQIIYDYKILPI